MLMRADFCKKSLKHTLGSQCAATFCGVAQYVLGSVLPASAVRQRCAQAFWNNSVAHSIQTNQQTYPSTHSSTDFDVDQILHCILLQVRLHSLVAESAAVRMEPDTALIRATSALRASASSPRLVRYSCRTYRTSSSCSRDSSTRLCTTQ